MAVTRRLAKYKIGVVAVFVVAHTFLLATWIGTITPAITPMHYLTITDVQFTEVYLNIMVKNNSTIPITISEVTIYQNSTPYNVPMHELSIAGGDEIPMRISRKSFNCTSGYTYQIRLTTTRDVSFFRTAVAP